MQCNYIRHCRSMKYDCYGGLNVGQFCFKNNDSRECSNHGIGLRYITLIKSRLLCALNEGEYSMPIDDAEALSYVI